MAHDDPTIDVCHHQSGPSTTPPKITFYMCTQQTMGNTLESLCTKITTTRAWLPTYARLGASATKCTTNTPFPLCSDHHAQRPPPGQTALVLTLLLNC